MITLPDCVSILDQHGDSTSFLRFSALASYRVKMKKEGGYRATYPLKADGIEVHLEYVERNWLILAVHLYGGKGSGFSAYAGELEHGLSMKSSRSRLREVLGAPSSTGGDGTVGRYGIVNRPWDRWDREDHSLRFDYEEDGSSIHVACLQRPRDVRAFEERRVASQATLQTPARVTPAVAASVAPPAGNAGR